VVRALLGAAVTSAERTAYPLFPKMVLARDLHVFFTPSPDEIVWARAKTDTDEHLLALTVALKCFQKMGRFPKSAEVPETVVDSKLSSPSGIARWRLALSRCAAART